jgi:predicted transcriptional regulator
MAKPEPAIFEDQDAALESAADAEGLADLAAGRVVKDEAMKAWLRSWGTPDELPPPNTDD